ncbi:hypothetical protein D9758_004376 [Tetrapyrgos nigripes]|uniref:Homeobox domain-containing protein n=1 Tax=Tetrapyrgos nigripes TaxID=182062 RepID=A0A8H5GN02_9AGAR|nr:hypothetical protein D9758_004376 [Tetrapyrgos nigripes]
MSKSPSPSLTTAIPSTKPSTTPTPTPTLFEGAATAPTISRHQTHDNSPPPQTGERVIRSPQFHSFVHSSTSPHIETAAGPSRPSRTRPREDSPEEQPMAKRIRRDSIKVPSDRSRSPSSEGGLADTEEAERSQQSEMSSAPVQAPKKKRTRTLTTPHQSAVLHALLAQSRFPTTAMREEVGRAIGLSARKVQIWFQNQRQKARRPRAQNEAPVQRPPQYGPFTNAPDADRPPLYTGPPPVDPRVFPEPQFDDRYHRYAPATAHPGSPPVSSPVLLGPGVPGFGSSARPLPPPLSMERISPEISPVTSRPYSSRPPFARTPSPQRVPRPSTSQSRLPYRDPSLTLPPLAFPPPGQRTPSIRSAPANMAPPYPYTEPSYESVILPRVENPPVGNLPPPFALQPQPQWDSSAFNPGSGTWSLSGSDRSLSTSPTTTRGLPPIRDLDESSADPTGSSRRARFDPVRSAITPPRSSQTPPRSSRSTDTRGPP